MILDRFKTLRKSQTSIQREGQARQGRLKCVCPKFRTDAKPKSTHRHSPYEYSYNSSQPHINCKHQTCLLRQKRTSVARKNSGDYRRDCPVAPNPATLSSIFLSNILIKSKFNFSVNNIAYIALFFHFLDFPPET